MRIGFDAKRVFFNHTGLGNYSRTLLKNLTQYFPEHEYHLFSPVGFNKSPLTEPFLAHPYVVHTPRWRGYGSLWRTLLGKKIDALGMDIFHGLTHELPLGLKKTPAVVTIHDLIFMRYPEYVSSFDYWIYKRKWAYACQRAEKIIAISEATKLDLMLFLGVPEEKICVVYQACDPLFAQEATPEELEQIRQKYALPQTFALCVGSLIPRKGQRVVLEALARLPRSQQIPIVFVGSGPCYKDLRTFVAQNNLESSVKFLQHVAHRELPFFYQASLFSIYLSHCEGFGLPVVESLLCKRAVLTSNISSLPEAAGRGGFLVSPFDVEAVADALEQLTFNNELRSALVAAGLEHVQKFNPQKTSAQVLDVYCSIIN